LRQYRSVRADQRRTAEAGGPGLGSQFQEVGMVVVVVIELLNQVSMSEFHRQIQFLSL